MKILLTLPVAPDAHRLNVVPPLGLGYLAASLLARGHDVSILNPVRDGLGHDEFRRRAADARPDVVGFSVYSCDVESVRADSAWIKANMPGVITVAGGPHPSAVQSRFSSQLPDIDYGVAGEGEFSFPRLLDAIASGGVVSGIPGIIHSGGMGGCLPPEIIGDLDSLPMPAWELLDPPSYPESPQGIFFKRLPIAQIVTTRGCPFPCAFCSGRNIHGLKVRKRSIPSVMDEIRFLTSRFGIREIHILDDNFTHSKAFAAEFCEALLADKIDISWCCPNGIRLDTLDAGLLALMKTAGCYSVSVGIESGSQKILDAMKKGLDKKTISEKVRLIKSAGLVASGFFIIGFPGETRETVEETIRFSREIPLDRASFFNFLPLPGTPSEALAYGGGAPEDYSKLYYTHTPYLPDGMTEHELKRLQRRAFLKFFLRPRIIAGILLSVRTFKQAGFIIKRMVSYLK